MRRLDHSYSSQEDDESSIEISPPSKTQLGSLARRVADSKHHCNTFDGRFNSRIGNRKTPEEVIEFQNRRTAWSVGMSADVRNGELDEYSGQPDFLDNSPQPQVRLIISEFKYLHFCTFFSHTLPTFSLQ